MKNCGTFALLAGALLSGLGALSASAAPRLVLHLDMKAAVWRPTALLQMLKDAKADGYDAILWEVEDKVRWDTCPDVAHPEAMDKATFRRVLDEARRLGLEPIPLLQTVGHGEYVLSRAKYRDFCEDKKIPGCYCVSKSEVRAFLARYLTEMLDLFGSDVKEFHLGGDEAFEFGTCPVCSKREKGALYAEHLESLAKILRARGIRPGCWCDMLLRGLGKDGPRVLPKDWTIWHWDYSYGVPGSKPQAYTARLPELTAHGYRVIFCAASQSWGDGPFLVDWNKHAHNVAASAAVVRTNNLAGLCLTSWSVRGAPKYLQRPLFTYAARELRRPGADAQRDWSACRAEYFGPHAAELAELGVFDSNLVDSFDARYFIRHYNPTGPVDPPGKPSAALAERARALRARHVKAFAATQDDPKYPLVGAIRRGAALDDVWLKALENYLSGKPYVLPDPEEMARFYAEEETIRSAAISSDIVNARFRRLVSTCGSAACRSSKQ